MRARDAGFGGLSGPAIKPIALRLVYQAARAVKIPVIGLGGISSGEDAAEFLVAGELSTFLRREKIARVADLVGTLKM